MNSNKIMQGVWIGLVTGIILALFLKSVQAVMGYKVYTLLLNVDYIPIVKNYQFPEVIEVSFHLIVSVILCIVLLLLLDKNTDFIRNRVIYFSFLINTAIGLLLYPTTTFSSRTPSFSDAVSLFWWIVGHALYGLLVGIMLKRTIGRKR
ncbi:hypothetical protein ORD22_12770 [Sporosarcina sp. GW1-11]|uniref:hypothetical protein n=1 Tax=Sporosarcina sp. GW1-11 TaxID=2899126 RepID=UPI00294F2138|nr:hypothetical protein [Sporosarcina sp. GW1-11]MDV6379088.1 hypothetical protein [Sporosarcina sp. GW1-11]